MMTEPYFSPQGTIPLITLPLSALEAMISRRRLLQSLSLGQFEDRFISLARSLLSSSSANATSNSSFSSNNISTILVTSPPVTQQLTPSVSPDTVLLTLALASISNLSLSNDLLSSAQSSTDTALDALSDALQNKEDLYTSILSYLFSTQEAFYQAELASLDQATQVSSLALNATSQSLVALLNAATKLVFMLSQASSQSLDLSSEKILESYGASSLRWEKENLLLDFKC